MGLLFKKFKTKFRYALKPFFVMLVSKRNGLSETDWLKLIDGTRLNIIKNPSEYLGEELPEHSLMVDILNEIFLEFLKERAFHDRILQKTQ